MSEIKIYFDVGNTEVAVLQTVFVIAYLVFAPLIGYLGDKLNRKYLIIIATLLEMTSVITGSFVQDSSKVIRLNWDASSRWSFHPNSGLQNNTKIGTQLTGNNDIMTNEIIIF